MDARGMIVGKTISSNPSYYLLCEDSHLLVKQYATQTDYAVGEFIQAEGRDERGDLEADKIVLLAGGERKALKEKIEARIELETKPLEAGLLLEDDCTRALKPAFAEAARRIMRAVFTSTPILLRYHDDADGVTSALSLKQAIEAFIVEKRVLFPKNFLREAQANSALYEEQNFFEDRDWAAGFQKKPLLLLLDHGANAESLSQVRQAREFFDVIAVDHHPPAADAREAIDLFITPFFAGGGSSHTTGLLCFEIARRITAGAREDLARISLDADHSDFRGEPRRESLVLDYLIISRDHSLADCAHAIGDEHTVDLYYKKAQARLRVVLDEARKATRVVREGDALIQVVKLEGLVKRNMFPQKSKCATEVQKRAEAENPGKPIVSLGYAKDSMSFRASESARLRGFKANEVIARLKQELPHAVESGGGHERAASMYFKKEFRDAVVEKAIEETRKALNAGSAGKAGKQ